MLIQVTQGDIDTANSIRDGDPVMGVGLYCPVTQALLRRGYTRVQVKEDEIVCGIGVDAIRWRLSRATAGRIRHWDKTGMILPFNFHLGVP